MVTAHKIRAGQLTPSKSSRVHSILSSAPPPFKTIFCFFFFHSLNGHTHHIHSTIKSTLADDTRNKINSIVSVSTLMGTRRWVHKFRLWSFCSCSESIVSSSCLFLLPWPPFFPVQSPNELDRSPKEMCGAWIIELLLIDLHCPISCPVHILPSFLSAAILANDKLDLVYQLEKCQRDSEREEINYPAVWSKELLLACRQRATKKKVSGVIDNCVTNQTPCLVCVHRQAVRLPATGLDHISIIFAKEMRMRIF